MDNRPWIQTRATVKTTAGALKNIATDKMTGYIYNTTTTRTPIQYTYRYTNHYTVSPSTQLLNYTQSRGVGGIKSLMGKGSDKMSWV